MLGLPGVGSARRFGVLMDVRDMGAVMAAMETQEGADAMAHDDVVRETLVILVEAPSSAQIEPLPSTLNGGIRWIMRPR